MVWWYWLLLGLVLLAAEMATPGGFYILFFGFAALIVGALAGMEWLNTAWLQWLLFSILSIISLFLFRNSLLLWMKAREPVGEEVDSMIGEMALLTEDLPPGNPGKVELRGTIWSARNAGQRVLMKGDRGRVEKVEGLTLWIKPE
ncbi:MAG TPA: NfeD family protein [Nitrospiraceae bacterium]|nr:NfeD family protein [Nitrospiraceae bacterium]